MTGEPWRLGHRPALDGLRGVAVLLVVVSHYALWTGDLGALGTAGVGLFFVLSGFLITTLLLEESERYGRVSFGAFYLRRAARLLPALVVLLVFELGVGAITGGQFAAALLYVSNWTQILTGDPTPISFTWSLSIEEQFYLLWPLALLVALRRSRRAVAVVALTGAGVSIALRLVLAGSEPFFAERATITNADGLLLGCALAAMLPALPVRRSMPTVVLELVAALAVLAWLVPDIRVVGTATALVGVCCVYLAARGSNAGLLAWRPLVLVGKRSYALYLWHVPVLKILLTAGLPLWGVAAIGIPASWCLALLSWRLIESPVQEAMRARLRQSAARVSHHPGDDTGPLTTGQLAVEQQEAGHREK